MTFRSIGQILIAVIALSGCVSTQKAEEVAAIEASWASPAALAANDRAVIIGKVTLLDGGGREEFGQYVGIGLIRLLPGTGKPVEIRDSVDLGGKPPVFSRESRYGAFNLRPGRYTIGSMSGRDGEAGLYMMMGSLFAFRDNGAEKPPVDLVVASGEVLYIGDITIRLGESVDIPGNLTRTKFTFSTASNIEAARAFLATTAPALAPALQERLLICGLCAPAKGRTKADPE